MSHTDDNAKGGENEAQEVTRGFIVPAELRCFEGHFEGAPVLPAIAQLEMIVVPMIRDAFDLTHLLRATRLKFLLPVAPDDAIEVTLSRPVPRGDERKVRFSIARDDELCAQGTLHFAKDDA